MPLTASCINYLWQGALATVLPLGDRGPSLRLVGPRKDARERGSNNNRRRGIHALLTPLDPNLDAMSCTSGQCREQETVAYAGFASPCNAQQPLPAHSQ
jgi:hypothetical protein